MCVLWRYTQWKNKCSSRAMWCPLWVLMLTIILVEKLKQIKWTFCNPFHSIHHLMEYPFPAYCISVFSFYFVSVRYRNCIFYFCIQMLSAIMNWTMLHICYRSAVKAASSYFFFIPPNPSQHSFNIHKSVCSIEVALQFTCSPIRQWRSLCHSIKLLALSGMCFFPQNIFRQFSHI